MSEPVSATTPSVNELLGDYLASVNKLPGKLAAIAANQRSSELSLGRAAAALRSMGALNRRRHDSSLGNTPPSIGNIDGSSR